MNSLNISVFNFIHYLAGRWWLLDWLGIFLAKYLPYLLIVAFLYFLLKENGRRRIYFFSLASLSVILSRGIIVEAIKFFYSCERPFASLGFSPLFEKASLGSFPSGHAAVFFALSMAVFYLNRKAGKWFFILSFLVVVARIFAGIHWPFDVLIGAVIGLLSALFVRKMLPKTEK